MPHVLHRATRLFRFAAVSCLAAFAVSARAADDAAETEPPNIILLMGDDHGWDETGYNGHPHLHTPVLDEMAASGLRLDRFYAAHPTCSPTRGSCMTGRHPNRYGTFGANHSIRPEEIGVAQLLGEAGYLCAHFGKWHLGPVKAESPTNPGALGFDQWLSHDNFFEMDPVLSRNGGPPESFSGESSELLVDEAIRFLGEADRQNRPSFAVVWFGSPHEPYSGLETDLARYEDLPDEYADRQVRLTSNETGEQVRRPRDQVLQQRYAEITAMDRAIGQLREWLDRQGLGENTLVWYCGDNGTSGDGIVTSPLRGQKAQVYDGGIRVPGVIEWPRRIDRPRVSTVNAVTSDVLPTLCELAGVPLPDRPLDGISLRPLIAGEMTERPEPICFWQYRGRNARSGEPYIAPELQQGTTPLVKKMAGRYTRNFRNFHYDSIDPDDYRGPRAILDGRYKLVAHERGEAEPVVELFDTRADPGEENDLTHRHPEVAGRLQRQLRQWQQSVLESLTGADYP